MYFIQIMEAKRTLTLGLTFLHIFLVTLLQDLSLGDRTLQAGELSDVPSSEAVIGHEDDGQWAGDWGKNALDDGASSTRWTVFRNGAGDPDLTKRWKEMAVWGKRNYDPEMDKRWKEMSVWGKRDSDDLDIDKKWKEMAVWGKRIFFPKMDKKWKEMAVWGKRNSDDLDLDKRWKEMAVWGKRIADPEMEKKWKEMAVWGKRDSGDLDMDKRWKEMAVWGKRNADPEMEKKWKEMAVWGKRDSGDLDVDERWKELQTWGKRNADPELEKKWKEMSVWGKRGVGTIRKQTVRDANIRRLLNAAFKRRGGWNRTGFSSWGKRSKEDIDLHAIGAFLQRTQPSSDETQQETVEVKAAQGASLSKT